MITRAQAEALLTLAESLEACEREGVGVRTTYRGDQTLQLYDKRHGYEIAGISALSGMKVRFAVNALIPKQETAHE